MGVKGIKYFKRCVTAFCREIEVAINIAIGKRRLVGICIGAITAAIDVAIDGSIDTKGITAIDRTGDIITAIDIVDMSSTYQHTRRQLCGEVVALQVRTRRIDAIHRRFHVSHTTTAIDIAD